MNISKSFKKIGNEITRNIPTILTCVGAIGLIGTAYLSGKAAVKTEKIKEEIQWKMYTKEEDKKRITEIALTYIPVFVAGGCTIVAIIFSNHIHTKRFKSVCSAYNKSIDRYSLYKLATVSVVGEETAKKIEDKIVDFQKEISKYPQEDTQILFIDNFSGQSFLSTELAVLQAQYDFNRNFQIRDFAYINELYDFYGIDHIEDVDILGFEKYELEAYWGYKTIDFNNQRHEEENGAVWYDIELVIEPWVIYEEKTTEDGFTYMELEKKFYDEEYRRHIIEE